MRSLRYLMLLLAFGFLTACGDLGPTASESDPPCEGDGSAEYSECEDDDDDDGYIGSGG